MLKISKIIFINILFIFIIICFLEITIYFIDCYCLRNIHKVDNKLNLQPYHIAICSFRDFYKKNKNEDWFFRPLAGVEYKEVKRPILILGCSFAYGHKLKNEETFSYQLAKYAKRFVINKANCGWGINTVLFQLRNDEDFKKIKDPEYIIYVFIPDHTRRFLSSCYFPYERYFLPIYSINKDNKLDENPAPSLFYKLYFVRRIDKLFNFDIKYKHNVKYYNSIFNVLKIYIEETYREVKKLYPDTKFVVLKYPNGEDWYIKTQRWKEIEKDDLIVLDAEELAGVSLKNKKYVISEDDCHPNAKAWEKIIPLLAKKLHL